MNPALEKGAAAVKAGKKQEAFYYLKQAINEDPRDVNAWLWLSSILDDPSKKRFCYQKVLEVDSQNQYAVRGMAKLNQQPSTPMQTPICQPASQVPISSPVIQSPYSNPKPNHPSPARVATLPKKKIKLPIWTMIGMGLFALVVFTAPFSASNEVLGEFSAQMFFVLLGHYVISGYVGAFKIIQKGQILQLVGCSILLGGLPILLPAVLGWFLLWWANRIGNKNKS